MSIKETRFMIIWINNCSRLKERVSFPDKKKKETRKFLAEKYFYFTPTQHGQSRFSRFVAIHEQKR